MLSVTVKDRRATFRGFPAQNNVEMTSMRLGTSTSDWSVFELVTQRNSIFPVQFALGVIYTVSQGQQLS